MVIRTHEQKRVIDRVHDIMTSYDNAELIMGELASLGFLRATNSPDPYAMENDELELYVRIRLNSDMSIGGYELLTFDEIRREIAAE
ncbi:hypothetical protein AZH53_03565 [Methanomicrobiaceae archaeon CYW5]|uniref:hypothetical protein n=1 Tax=Methanovulcanius yangii TaxID=1789227 RepID=UPI0029CA80E1|nr:hypothetical protein [Methanovulcanius yangii]MBT8507503.1 hypothetical protein [Methanovulcanius yangii]